jgi:hypothetical protein
MASVVPSRASTPGPRPTSLPAHVRAGLVEALAELLVAEYTRTVADAMPAVGSRGGGQSLQRPAAGPVATHARDFEGLKASKETTR